MIVAVFADMHGHAEAFDAVLEATQGVDERWSLGDMVGTGPDPDYVVARTREHCRVALLGNHDYLALRDTPANPSIELARERLDEDARAWMRSRKPAARRAACQLWHGGPHNAVHEFVGPRNAPACLEKQQEALGLVGHTHVAAAFHDGTRRVRIAPDTPLDISAGKWLLNPGAVHRHRLLARARPRGADGDLAGRGLRSRARARACAGARARVPGMSTQVVVARLEGLTGRASELRTLLADRARVVRAEPGCAGYEVAELVDEPAAFLIVQTWTSSEALRAHFSSAAQAEYQHEVDELLANPSQVVLHDVASTTRPSASTSPTDPGRFG